MSQTLEQLTVPTRCGNEISRKEKDSLHTCYHKAISLTPAPNGLRQLQLKMTRKAAADG